jgi:glycosyltransferase involved in cell wall biosynthesis
VRTLGNARRRLSCWILESFAHVIAVNQEIAEAMQGLGLRGARLSVIPAYLGVSPTAGLDPADRSVVNGGRPLLVAVGGGDRDPELGLPTIVDALPDLARAFPQLRVVFLGWQVGPKTQPLIDVRDLGKHAVCIGQVSHERCLGFLQKADVVIRSTFTDGDAITVREALDLGIPVVASDTDFRPDGVTLFRKGDARDLRVKLEQVLANPPGSLARDADGDQSGRALWQIYSGLLR